MLIQLISACLLNVIQIISAWLQDVIRVISALILEKEDILEWLFKIIS